MDLMIREAIRKKVKEAVEFLQNERIFPDFELSEIEVGRPQKPEHGDYSVNTAMIVAKETGKDPFETAEVLSAKIDREGPYFSKIECVRPGFINFFLKNEYLQNQLGEIIRAGEDYGSLKEREKVNVEFISGNPTGPLHIGNGRNAFAGDVLANVLVKSGREVVREYFINDATSSLQIASIKDTVSQIGSEEAKANLPYYTPYLEEKVRKMGIQSGTEQIIASIQEDNRKFITEKLKIKFDSWVSEKKDIYGKGKTEELLNQLKEKGLVYEKEGALWLKTSLFGSEKDWVIVRKNGEGTYLLGDIAYHKDKFDRGFQKVIDIWGADHQAHVSKMKAAAEILGYKGNFEILILQLVTLKGKEKLSKRSGNIITLEELVDEIGLDAARWFYLQKSLDTHMEIDIGLAKEQSERNPVYYVQYAHARICSILRKAEAKDFSASISSLLNHPSELRLLREIAAFPEVVEDTAKDYQMQRLAKYALSLAGSFHQFYGDCKVISEDEELTQARLSLAAAAKIALRNSLSLMGISAPEKM
jgi:arginyl-tRNA synthetase